MTESLRQTLATLVLVLLAIGVLVGVACSRSSGLRANDAEQQLGIDALVASIASGAELAKLTVDYPLDESIFPPEMTVPTFLWHETVDAVDRWLVDVTFSDGSPPLRRLLAGGAAASGIIDPRCLGETNEIYQPTEYQASAHSWKPSDDDWAAIKRHSVKGPATVRFVGYRNVEPAVALSGGVTRLTTSRDAVAASIFYRDVPLMPAETEDGVIKPLAAGAVPLIDWRLRDISRPDSRIVLRDMPTCANCHSFSADGKTMGIDVDGPQGDKGAYAMVAVKKQTVIRDEDVMTWNAYEKKTPGLNSLGFLARVSPDGRYSIATVNEALFVRNFWDYKFGQVFFPTRGILAVYDSQTGEIHELPGADDTQFVHCNPVWSPDGKTVVFSRANALDPYDFSHPQAEYSGDPNETQIKYDLYRIPFNGGRGGHAEAIPGASQNGMSNSFPKLSPDGKWMVWVQSANGQLMRRDSRLWIMPAAGGVPREMRCNTSLMNSWHSFSPSGSWMIFSSKSNTPYTQMFITHIDSDGNDSPAVLIPNSTAANRAVNLPEFVNVGFDDFESISVPAVDHYLYFARGNELAREGKPLEALAQYERALEGSGQAWRLNDWRLHDSVSKTLLQLGEPKRALKHARESLQLNPYNAEMQANAGYLLFELDQVGQALEHLEIALQLNPRDPRAWYNRGSIRFRTGDNSGALEDYDEAIRRWPEFVDAHVARGLALAEQGDLHGALADFESAILMDENNPAPLYFRARIRNDRGDTQGAIADLRQAQSVAAKEWEHHREVQALLSSLE